ncbi:hypothetical protein [Kibdelosporangium phytohabitans]|uniref:hypothetical protein n=1 Tax=Kibdelosporangium phytohabitans TaxID=860235 RepID=UPI00146FF304|nr:hypothetical protein [Kibdelosporangium phytohabitans]MBE1465731.1 hypothetical protein [Kibdelosporangium phytohabitans]
MSGGTSAKRRTLIWVAAAVVALGVAAAIVLITRSGDTSDAADEGDRGVEQRTQEFLKGDGALLLTMHEVAQAVATGAVDCPTAIARLDREAPSDRAGVLAASVDDGELESYMSEEREALGLTLAACKKDPNLDEAIRKVQSRLDALGIRR